MRRSLLALGLWLVGILPAAAQEAPIVLSDALTVEPLTPHAYVVTHRYPWPANTMLVEMANQDLVLVDTPASPEACDLLLRWAEGRFGKRRMVALNTHFHNDRLGGNEALLKAHVPIYGSDLTVRTLQEREPRLRAQLLGWLEPPLRDEVAKQRFFAPDHVFKATTGLRLAFGKEHLEAFYPGAGHSPDNLVVYFPEERILFGGCLVMAGDRVGNTSDADLAAWPRSVAKLRRFDARWVIPGHGERRAPDLIDHTLKLLAEFRPAR